MPALEALTFDIDLNTSAFEQGAHNVEAILQNLLGGAFHNLAQSVENISQNLLGLSGSGAQMSAALSESGQSAVAALTNVSNAGSQMGNALTEGAQQTTTALTETGDAAQQMAAMLSQSGGEALESLKALYVDMTQQGQSGAEAMNALMGVITQGGQTNTEVLNALIAALTQTGQSGAEAMEKLTAALTQSGNVGTEVMKSLQDAISRVGVQAQTTATQTATFWEATAKRIEFSMRTALRSFIGPMAAVFGISSMFREYTSTADRLGKFAKTFDPTANIEDIQSWGEAAKRSGGSVEGFQMSLRSLNRQLQMGTVSGKKGGGVGGGLGALLKEMKISAKENGKTKDVFRLLTDIAGGAEKMGSGRFAGLAAAARLDQGTIQLLQKGRAEVEKLVERQRALGTYTERDAKIAAAFNDAIADLTQVFKAFASIIMRTVTPVITAIADVLTRLILIIKENETLVRGLVVILGGQLFGKIFPKGLDLLMRFGGRIKETAVTIVSSIARVKLSFASLWTTIKSLFASVMGLFKAFVLPFIIEDLIYFALGKKSLTGYAWYKLKGYLEKAKEWISKIIDDLKQKWEETLQWISDKWNAFVEAITGWMPEDLKKRLGLIESTPEEKFEQEVDDETKRRQAEDTVGQKTWEEHNNDAREFVKAKYKSEGKEVPDVVTKAPSVVVETPKTEKPRNALLDDFLPRAQEKTKEIFTPLNVVTANEEKSPSIAEIAMAVASHRADEAIAPTNYDQRQSHVTVNVDQNNTFNNTTNDPQALADKMPPLLQRGVSREAQDIVDNFNNGGGIGIARTE